MFSLNECRLTGYRRRRLARYPVIVCHIFSPPDWPAAGLMVILYLLHWLIHVILRDDSIAAQPRQSGPLWARFVITVAYWSLWTPRLVWFEFVFLNLHMANRCWLIMTADYFPLLKSLAAILAALLASP